MAATHTVVPHIEVGIFLIASPQNSNVQSLVNPMTSEIVNIDKTETMISRDKSYTMHFNKSGMAYLLGSGNKVWVSGLEWRRLIVQDVNGNLAVHDNMTKEKVPASIHDRLKSRITRTLQVTHQFGIPISIFDMELGILKSRLGQTPGIHQLGGRCFWEFRHLRPGLIIDKETKDSEATWEKRNYHNIVAAWSKLHAAGGGVFSEAHHFQSQRSWTATQLAAAKADTLLTLF